MEINFVNKWNVVPNVMREETMNKWNVVPNSAYSKYWIMEYILSFIIFELFFSFWTVFFIVELFSYMIIFSLSYLTLSYFILSTLFTLYFILSTFFSLYIFFSLTFLSIYLTNPTSFSYLPFLDFVPKVSSQL